jgi:hypothetical protein
VQGQIERWQLPSGTWLHDPQSETWRLGTTASGTNVSPAIPGLDLGHMVWANRDAGGAWFPPEFAYSDQTGAMLQPAEPPGGAPWVPPFGDSVLADFSRPAAHGLRQTRASLRLARTEARFEAGSVDRSLPVLPPDDWQFAVHGFDAACPLLLAVGLREGQLRYLLPESRVWAVLEGKHGGLAPGLANSRGWRMELVPHPSGATLYLPTARGLAAINPQLLQSSYTVMYSGDGAALGGPVAWAGEIWIPLKGADGCVQLVGRPLGASKPIVLRTGIPAPANGFESPVFDSLHVNWPCHEGQLVVCLDAEGDKWVQWVRWPQGAVPVFGLGCPYRSPTGAFWQLCRRSDFVGYVQMAQSEPAQHPGRQAPALCTGTLCWQGVRCMEGDPWEGGGSSAGACVQAIVPLLESAVDGTAVVLRINAPEGVFALAERDGQQQHRALLQMHVPGDADLTFGTLICAQPWRATVFVHDSHLWVHHAGLAQPCGWELSARSDSSV